MSSNHLRDESIIPPTIAKTPSTRVYAPKKRISTKRVLPGQKSAASLSQPRITGSVDGRIFVEDQGIAPWSGYFHASWLLPAEESSLASRLWLLL
jgi:hypothetical protein